MSELPNNSQRSVIRGKRTPRFRALLRPGADAELEVEVLVAEGDRVVTRWTGTGTHEGDLMGISATGNRVTVAGIDISPISSEGKIAESWSNYDVMGMMQQLGVIPSPGEAQA